MRVRSHLFIFIATFSFLIISRLYKIDQIPVALVHDEIIQVMQAKSLLYSGKDMSGTWNPLSLTPFNISFGELTPVIMAPGLIFNGNQIFVSKLIPAIIGILFPFVIAWYVYGIWRNKNISIIALIIAAINPWLWQVSRMSVDNMFNPFFYLLGGSIIFNLRGWWKLFSVPLLMLGFFQYQGLKIVFIPFVLINLLILIIKEKIIIISHAKLVFNKRLISISSIIFLFCFLLFIWYMFIALPKQSAYSRLSQIIFTNQELITKNVDLQRRLSIETPLLIYISNKYIEITKFIISRLYDVINPNFIFVSAYDPSTPYNVSKHGIFYIFEYAFLISGLYVMLIPKAGRWENWLYILMLVLSSMPALISTNESFMFRAGLFYILLIPIISKGICEVVKKNLPILNVSIIGVYVIGIALFSYQYLYQYPVYAADGQFFSERILASYIHRIASSSNSIIVQTHEPEVLMRSYLFYNNLYSTYTYESIKKAINNKQLNVENVYFVQTCAEYPNITDDTVIILERGNRYCDSNSKDYQTLNLNTQLRLPHIRKGANLSIPAVNDNGELFNISNDALCSKYKLSTYIVPRKLSLFTVEKLSDVDFCMTWITDQSKI